MKPSVDDSTGRSSQPALAFVALASSLSASSCVALPGTTLHDSWRPLRDVGRSVGHGG